MKNNPKLIALAQAVCLTAYIMLVALFMKSLQNWFGPQKDDPILAPMIFLLMFIISALVSSSIMLAYPVILFFKGKRKTAIKIVLMSTGWLAVFLIAIMLIAINK